LLIEVIGTFNVDQYHLPWFANDNNPKDRPHAHPQHENARPAVVSELLQANPNQLTGSALGAHNGLQADKMVQTTI
jgi:hypothetical protein